MTGQAASRHATRQLKAERSRYRSDRDRPELLSVKHLSASATVRRPAPPSLQRHPCSMPDGRAYAKATLCITQGTLRSEEHTSELQSLMRISYAVFCLKKKNYETIHTK